MNLEKPQSLFQSVHRNGKRFDEVPDGERFLHFRKLVIEIEDRTHLGVIYVQGGPFIQERLGHVNGWTLPGVAGVLFECETQNRDLLATDGVEQRLDNFSGESGLLILVHVNDLLPVCRHFRKVEALAYVNQIQDVLLETAPAETDKLKTIQYFARSGLSTPQFRVIEQKCNVVKAPDPNLNPRLLTFRNTLSNR